jgi:hypothetical protein
MTTEIKRDRSPNFPKMPLAQALEIVAGLHKKAGKSQIRAEVAANALGYSGLNGAALTTIGALNQYGLLERARGEGISVSPLAIRLLHPVSDAQIQTDRREAALKPRVFEELATGGFQHAADEVITHHLIQQVFTHDGARRASSVFLANAGFTHLHNDDIKPSEEMKITAEQNKEDTSKPPPNVPSTPPSKPAEPPLAAGEKVLAKYSVPLGSNEATIVFTGTALHPEDFDALVEYVQLFKRQYERKLVATAANQELALAG